MDWNNRSDREKSTFKAENIPIQFCDDEFYRALASSTRRRILFHLIETTQTTIEELATFLTGWELSTIKTLQQSGEHNDVLINLHHHHLPRLANAGLIEYQSEDGSVTLRSLHPQVKEIIRHSIVIEQHNG